MTWNKRLSHRIGNAAITLVMLALAAAMLFPILFMAASSFMGRGEILHSYGAVVSGTSGMRIHLIPDFATLQGYAEVFWLTPSYLIKFWNSLLITAAIVLGQTVVACISGYGFAKFSFPFKNVFFYLLVVLMMMPLQVTLVSNYIVLDRLGWIGSYAALVWPGMFAAFGVFLLTQVFSALPDELLESAKIDGANHLQILLRIVIPYSRTGIASLVILCFIDNWNMVEQPLVFLKDRTMYPLSVFLASVNTQALDIAFVCGLLTMLPAVLLFLHLKDALIQGIEYSNLK